MPRYYKYKNLFLFTGYIFCLLFILCFFYINPDIDINAYLEIIYLNTSNFDLYGLEQFSLPIMTYYFLIMYLIVYVITEDADFICTTFLMARFTKLNHIIVYIIKHLFNKTKTILIIYFSLITMSVLVLFKECTMYIMFLILLNSIKIFTFIYILCFIYIFLRVIAKKNLYNYIFLFIAIQIFLEMAFPIHFITFDFLVPSAKYLLLLVLSFICIYFILLVFLKKIIKRGRLEE